MLSPPISLFLRRLSFVLFIVAFVLLVPYGIEARRFGADVLPSTGLMLSSACGFLSLLVLLGDPNTSSRGASILIAHLDLIFSIGMFVVVVLSYIWIGQIYRSREYVLLVAHGTTVLLVQSVSHFTLAVSTLGPLISSALSSMGDRTCPNCGYNIRSKIGKSTSVFHPLDPEARGETAGRIALPMSPPPERPSDETFTLSSKARAFRFYTALIVFLYVPTLRTRSLPFLFMTACPLLASGALCLIMTANEIRRSQASKPIVYWVVVAEDLAIGAGNIAIFFMLLVMTGLRYPGQFIVGMAHIGFALKAIMDWLDSRRARKTMGSNEQNDAVSAAGGVSPGNGHYAASQPDVEVSRSHTDARDQAQAAPEETQRLLDA